MSRPSLYKPTYSAKVLTLMKKGASKFEVAAELVIHRDTLNEWAKKYPEFSDAIKKGEILSQAWWERQAREGLNNRLFNTALWYINMKNRFKWSDRAPSTETDYGAVSDALTNW